MEEKIPENIEKVQIEGFIEQDKALVRDQAGIEEFYNTSYIGDLEESDNTQVLILNPLEILLLLKQWKKGTG